MNDVPLHYIPKTLKKTDRHKQERNIRKSRKLYKRGEYFQRPAVQSFHSRPSKHIENAKKLYGVDTIMASNELARKSGCSVLALEKILNKGRGAYYSSGSRPNQTAESWARARLASAITGGPASKVDYSILEDGCHSRSMALKLSSK